MRVLIISGSRNPQGQTATAGDALAAGVTSEGGQANQVFLPKLKIGSCRQCQDNGWGLCSSEGRCVIEDDFAQIVEKVKTADAVVFATPVYYGDLSESMKSFTDRLRRICTHETGRAGVAQKPAVGICVAGGSGGGAPNCTVSLERVLASTGFDVVDMVPAKRQNLQMKHEVLKTVGAWLVRSSEA